MSKLTRKYGFTMLVLSVIALCLSAIFMPNVHGQNPMIGNKTLAKNNDITQSLQGYKDNLTSIFGNPLFEETSHKRTGSIAVSDEGLNQTQDSYIATGILQGVGNVTDNATYITTHLDKGHSSSEGTGIISTSDGFNVTYTGKDVGTEDSSGIETYKGIQIFKANSDSKLAFLNNVIGIYLYGYWPNGTTSGTVWEWK
jgi:hypothetical protein